MSARWPGRPITPSAARKPWPVAGAAVVCLSLLAAACSAAAPPPARRMASAGAVRPGVLSPPPELQVTPAPYQLPASISREVALPVGRDLLIAGGLLASSASTAAVQTLNPVTGRTAGAGRLSAPTHDAAGAVLGGRAFLFGGGGQAILAAVQPAGGPGSAAAAARLPRPRADLSAVSIGGTAYILGGFDGISYDRSVLATTDGRHFRQLATLPVAVRYAAVAATARQIWVFGGQTAAGLTSVIQRVSPATGRASVVGHLPQPLAGASALVLGGRIYLAGGQVPAGGGTVTTGTVLGYDPARGSLTTAGQLPVPVANAAAAVLGSTGYLIGGSDGQQQVPTVTMFRLVRPTAALPPASVPPATAAALPGRPAGRAGGALTGAARGRYAPAGPVRPGGSILASAPWLRPAHGRGHLAPHSDPSALPGDILIADNWNNRLLIVDPQGRIRWRFPRRGDLRHGQTFLLPDDAFFSPDGKYIVATEEEDSVISVINIATHRIVYRYGTPGVPGSAANQVANPDDAMMMPRGQGLLSADIENCRLLVLRPPAHRPRRIIGHTGSCLHSPPATFGSPNGAFPATSGDYIVTEINGDWANEMNLSGRVAWSAHPPGVSYPSDTNEVYPGRYLTADYSSAGQLVEFSPRGRLLWRMGGLNHPSLALPLPNGDILANDDYNDRVIVADPATHRIVWQYGHTGVPGTQPGFLNDPDGVDLTPPDSMLITHGTTMGLP